MLRNSHSTTLAIALMAAFSVWSMTLRDASAQGTHEHDGHSHSDHPHPGSSAAGAPAGQSTPHGGQFSVAGPLRFEVVYLPQETRVYFYDPQNRPISARGASGRALMTVRGYEKVYPYPATYVDTGAGSGIQDFLVVTVNVSKIEDGAMSVAFELTNLPSRELPAVRFAQTFALSRLPVTVAELDESDGPRIERQKVCVVTGGELGSMGTPLKLLVGDQPVYLCCKGCLAKVQQNPAAYLPKATPAQSVWTCSMHPQVKLAAQGKCPMCGMNLVPARTESGSQARQAATAQRGTAATNRMVVSEATAADRAAIAQQGVCVVSGGRLGAMGTPVRMTANGQSLFVCCKGCVGKVEKNPAGYFAKAAELREGR